MWCGVAGRGVRVCVCVRARARACGHACGVWAEAERHSQAKDNAVCVCVCVVCRALRVCGGGEGVRVGGGRQRRRWPDGITNSIDMGLGGLR